MKQSLLDSFLKGQVFAIKSEFSMIKVKAFPGRKLVEYQVQYWVGQLFTTTYLAFLLNRQS